MSASAPRASTSAFDAFNPPLSSAVVEALHAHGFTHATPVQEAAIPRLMCHQDVVVQAATGSGKTLSFILPLLEVLGRLDEPLRPHQVGGLIIEPTRELAQQVFAVAQRIAGVGAPGLRLALMVGGTDVQQDMIAYRASGGNVLIGTPGRLDDVMERMPEMRLRELELLVLDEADRLLDMGFEVTLNAILGRLPKQRRTGLFSATQTVEVLQLVRAGLRNPVKVEVKVRAVGHGTVARASGSGVDSEGAAGGMADGGKGSREVLPKVQAIPSTLTSLYMIADGEDRLAQLVRFLHEQLAAKRKLMVYFLTCACVDYYAAALPQLKTLAGSPVRALHGKMVPKRRTKTYEWFVGAQEGAALLCTDVAARGLDIADVDWIVQFDAPQDPNAFVHRVGRTARMGRSGRALLMLRAAEDTYVNFLELRKVPLTRVEAVPGLPSLRTELTRLLATDRALMEGAARAYVAYVRAYKEHQCNFIFQLDKLDLGELARALAVLRLPKLKELRAKKRKQGEAGWVEWSPIIEVDVDTIPFKDKQREKQRKANIKARHEAAEAAEASEEEEVEHEAVSKAVSARARGDGSAAVEVAAAAATAEKAARKAEKARERREANEEGELAREASLLKKLRRGKLTQSEFDRLMGEAEADDDDDDDDADEDEGDEDEGHEDEGDEDEDRGGHQRSGAKGQVQGGMGQGGAARGRQEMRKGAKGGHGKGRGGGGKGRGSKGRGGGGRGRHGCVPSLNPACKRKREGGGVMGAGGARGREPEKSDNAFRRQKRPRKFK